MSLFNRSHATLAALGEASYKTGNVVPPPTKRLLASNFVPPEHIVNLCVDHLISRGEEYFQTYLQGETEREATNQQPLATPAVDRGLYILWVVFRLYAGREFPAFDGAYHTSGLATEADPDRLEVVSIRPINLRTFAPENKKSMSLIAAYAEALETEYEEDIVLFKSLPLKLRLSTTPPLRPPPNLAAEGILETASMNVRWRLSRRMVCWFTVENEHGKPFLSKIVTVPTIPDEEEEEHAETNQYLGAPSRSPSIAIHSVRPTPSPSAPRIDHRHPPSAHSPYHGMHKYTFNNLGDDGGDRDGFLGETASFDVGINERFMSPPAARTTPSYPRDDGWDVMHSYSGDRSAMALFQNFANNGASKNDNSSFAHDGGREGSQPENSHQSGVDPHPQPHASPFGEQFQRQPTPSQPTPPSAGDDAWMQQLSARMMCLEDSVATISNQINIIMMALTKQQEPQETTLADTALQGVSSAAETSHAPRSSSHHPVTETQGDNHYDAPSFSIQEPEATASNSDMPNLAPEVLDCDTTTTTPCASPVAVPPTSKSASPPATPPRRGPSGKVRVKKSVKSPARTASQHPAPSQFEYVVAHQEEETPKLVSVSPLSPSATPQSTSRQQQGSIAHPYRTNPQARLFVSHVETCDASTGTTDLDANVEVADTDISLRDLLGQLEKKYRKAPTSTNATQQ